LKVKLKAASIVECFFVFVFTDKGVRFENIY